MASRKLPIHFMTLVLNGMPFMRYHIDIFKSLPFNWTWHIVEGLAGHNGDSSWCKARGGFIPTNSHKEALSIDGTTEYLDQLVKEYPKNVTVYRPEPGNMWHNKTAMANAAAKHIKKEGLLWQIDADEIWTADQICKVRDLFLTHENRNRATFKSHYFVGPDRVIYPLDFRNPRHGIDRVWRFKPGNSWYKHEPPVLVDEGRWIGYGYDESFSMAETESFGLVYQHYAYVTDEQVKFKQDYYGYYFLYQKWLRLQKAALPVPVREYFSWVTKPEEIRLASACGVTPLFDLKCNKS